MIWVNALYGHTLGRVHRLGIKGSGESSNQDKRGEEWE
jgi:hypothetical protein